jgi:hypothetical protein
VAGGWWLVAGGWWLVAGGWWLGEFLLEWIAIRAISHKDVMHSINK